MESQKQTRSISLPFEISNFKSAILGYCAHSRSYVTPSQGRLMLAQQQWQRRSGSAAPWPTP